MYFGVNDETWSLITFCFDRGVESLSPTTKILVENLLASLQINRTITSSYEADLIITLLLSCAQSLDEAMEDENIQYTHSQAKDNWYEENTNLIIKINQVKSVTSSQCTLMCHSLCQSLLFIYGNPF